MVRSAVPARWLSFVIALGILSAVSGCTHRVGQAVILHARAEPRPPMSDAVSQANIDLALADGTTVRGWVLSRPGSRQDILFFYDNASTLLDAMSTLYAVSDALEADVFAFDYRGYGFSEGVPSLRSMVDDALPEYEFVRARHAGAERPLVVIGEALGTAPAARVASRHPVGSLILMSPFSSFADLVAAVGRATHGCKVIPDDSVSRIDLSPETDLRTVTAPILIVHGKGDELATPDMVRKLDAASPSPAKTECAVDGGRSDVRPENPQVRACVAQFQRSVSGAAASPPPVR
jgi:fermentation-respiration switch protein FrsA (DUF1100 family)